MDISDGELAPQEMRIRWRSLFSIPIPRIDHRHKIIMEFLRVFAIVPPALEQALGVRCGLRGSNLITISPRATPPPTSSPPTCLPTPSYSSFRIRQAPFPPFPDILGAIQPSRMTTTSKSGQSFTCKVFVLTTSWKLSSRPLTRGEPWDYKSSSHNFNLFFLFPSQSFTLIHSSITKSWLPRGLTKMALTSLSRRYPSQDNDVHLSKRMMIRSWSTQVTFPTLPANSKIDRTDKNPRDRPSKRGNIRRSPQRNTTRRLGPPTQRPNRPPATHRLFWHRFGRYDMATRHLQRFPPPRVQPHLLHPSSDHHPRQFQLPYCLWLASRPILQGLCGKHS